MKGFSLVEVLVSIAILGIIAVSAASLLTGVMRSERRNGAISRVEIEANYALYQITQSVRNATAVTVPSLAASGTSLTVAVAMIPAQNPTIVARSGTQVTLKRGTAAALPLTTDMVQVTGLTFTNVTANTTKGAVRIALTVANTNPSGAPELAYTKTYYTTVTLR